VEVVLEVLVEVEGGDDDVLEVVVVLSVDCSLICVLALDAATAIVGFKLDLEDLDDLDGVFLLMPLAAVLVAVAAGPLGSALITMGWEREGGRGLATPVPDAEPDVRLLDDDDDDDDDEV
jgi:hypothetical protein